MQPSKLVVSFASNLAIKGLDFNYDSSFDPVREVFIAEFVNKAPDMTGGKPESIVGNRWRRLWKIH
ncbi:hypothetical protein [Paenisporosarcina indica]|uniref:hypothetical protein n=1 Tax=Paenisporosarcina indica TaxID=650093 RepID=UPI000A9D83AB|nr:hypothetical protein [Paenisporosarcina indica]